MRTRGEIHKVARLLVLLVVGFAVIADPDSRAMAASKGDGARVYIVRGGGGYFPNLGTVINEKFLAKGLTVVERRFDERYDTAYEIVNSYRKGELLEGVILVGYSLGGCGAIRISRTLQEYGIPVRMLFLIETINPLQTVPANVKDCFNLYHFPALLGVKVRADSEETNLINCEAHRDAGFGSEYSHFALPFVDGVHDLIAGELVAALQDRPLGETAMNRFRLSP